MFAGEARCGGSAWRLVWSQQPNLDYGDVLQTRSEGSLGAVSVDRMKEPTGAGHCGARGMYADTEDVRWAWPSARPGPHWRPLPVLGHLLLCILCALEQPSRPPPPAPRPVPPAEAHPQCPEPQGTSFRWVSLLPGTSFGQMRAFGPAGHRVRRPSS